MYSKGYTIAQIADVAEMTEEQIGVILRTEGLLSE